MAGSISSSEHARLRAESQRIRAEAIRVRISAVHAFCSVVESEARWESPARAQESMGKVWRAVAELKRHVADPKHVSHESAGELLALLAGLEDRAVRIHQSIQGGSPYPRSSRPQIIRTRQER